MNKNQLIQTAKETLAISQTKSYQIENRIYKIPAVEHSEFYSDVHRPAGFAQYPSTKIELTGENTVDAIFRLSKQYESHSLGVLNFASAHHPGGGFLNGAMAQEECLAQCSNLYLQQTTGVGPLFYEQNEGCIPGLYTDGMLISETVFFRNGQFNLVPKPVVCQVLTSPAVNMSALRNSRTTPQAAQETMLTRMRKVLWAFIGNGCSAVILGAFGCGVFGNDAGVVAENWKQLLCQEGLKENFQHICFAVMGKNSSNYKAFATVWNM